MMPSPLLQQALVFSSQAAVMAASPWVCVQRSSFSAGAFCEATVAGRGCAPAWSSRKRACRRTSIRGGEQKRVDMQQQRESTRGGRGCAAMSGAEEARASTSTEERAPGGGDGEATGGGRLETDVVVIGAGLAGLAAARHLAASGVPLLLVEASDGVGGRVRTDHLDGFLLDRGFQIFITAYPEAKRLLNYDALRLHSFYAGALVWFNGSFHCVADPLRHLRDGLLSLSNPIGNVLDKILVGLVRLQAASRSEDEILSAPETSIFDRLASVGFSASMVDRFFRPFFGGIFFDNQLQTSSRLFDFVFKCLALGSNTLPAAGIGAISQQFADGLPQGSILLNSEVMELAWGDDGHPIGARLKDGKLIKTRNGIVLAVEGPKAAKLLRNSLPATPSTSRPPRSTVCLYFAAEKAPIKEPILLLNGTGKGIVNNMFFPTTVAPSYSPPGKALVSVSLVGFYEDRSDADLEQSVRSELSDWFGESEVSAWRHLRTYRIKLAQPDQAPPTDLRKEPRVQMGVYVCGDHRDSATFDGALVSGRRAAEALLADSKVVQV